MPAFSNHGTGDPSDVALGDIPPDYRRRYQQAGDCPGLDWSILAAIGKIETDQGRSTLPGSRSGENAAAGPSTHTPAAWTPISRSPATKSAACVPSATSSNSN